MKKILLGMFVGLLILSGCSNPWKKDDRLVIVSTIFPLGDMAGQIGGEKVRSEVLIPAGSSVHVYEPKPSDLKKVAEADLILVVGAGLDDWAKKMAEEAGVAADKIIDLSQWVDLRNFPDTSEEKGSSDPHYWLSPKRMLDIYPKLVEEMGKVSPENKTYFETNGEDFKTDLTKLDEEMALTIFNFKSKDIITFHEGFNYLAGDYGLNVIGSIEPVTGTEPTAEQIQQITDQIKNLQVKAVFSEPQLSSKVIESLRNDLGIEVGILDPLGGLGGRMTYVALMKYNLLELKRFLE